MAEAASLPASSRPYLIARGIGLVAGLLGAIIAARLLGPDARGSLGLFVFFVALGAAGLGIGLPTAVYDLSVGRPSDRRRAIVGARVIAALAGISGAGILLVANSGPGGVLAGLPTGLVALAGGLGIGGTILVQAHTMAAVARGATFVAAAGQSLPVLLAALSYVVSLVLLHASLGGAILGYGLAMLVAALLVGARGPGPAGADGAGGGLAATIRSLVSRGARVALSDVAYVLSYRVDVVLVAALAGLASLGRYSVGVQLVEPMAVAGTALGMAILGAAAGAGPSAALHRTVGLAARISVLMCLDGGCVATAGALLLGSVLLGPGYDSVPAVMAILVPGVAAIAVSRVLSGAVIGHGGLGIGSVIALATVAVNVVFNVLLVPTYAEIGAAVASSVAYLLSLTLWLRAWRTHGGNLGILDLLPRPSDAGVLLRAITGRASGTRSS